MKFILIFIFEKFQFVDFKFNCNFAIVQGIPRNSFLCILDQLHTVIRVSFRKSTIRLWGGQKCPNETMNKESSASQLFQNIFPLKITNNLEIYRARTEQNLRPNCLTE